MMLDKYRIKKIFEKPTLKIINFLPTQEVLEVDSFINNLYGFLTSQEYKNINHKEAFLLTIDTKVTNANSKKIFNELIKLIPQYNNFIINFKEEIKEFETINNDSFNDLEDYSEEHLDTIFFYINHFCIEIIYNGMIIKRIANVNDIKKMARSKNSDLLKVEDYRLLANNHFKEYVLNEKKLTYWDKKSDRLLKKSPENIFHKSLYSYLDINLANGRVDSEVSNKGGNDRLDIQLVDFDTEKLYILEIKWMGKSITSTSYNKKDMENAFKQLNIYLNNNNNAIKGALIVYDASDKDEEIICSLSNNCNKLDKEPIKLYLISESASVQAKK